MLSLNLLLMLTVLIMSRMFYDYTKSVLENVSFDPELFKKELKKAMKKLLPHELENLRNWLKYYTENKPDLKPYAKSIMEKEFV